jgi:hypothetical protein
MKSGLGSPMKLGGAVAAGVRPAPGLTAFPPYLDHLVSDVAMIPAQPTCDLLNREAAHEHVTQLVQLLIRPFPAGVLGRRLDVSHGPLRIQDRGTDQAQKRFVLRISRAAEERAEFYISHATA